MIPKKFYFLVNLMQMALCLVMSGLYTITITTQFIEAEKGSQRGGLNLQKKGVY